MPFSEGAPPGCLSCCPARLRMHGDCVGHCAANCEGAMQVPGRRPASSLLWALAWHWVTHKVAQP